ncbi:hypothetical protein OESDEN_11939 [Oesophagostomum dentatum]|uniref:Uncharacterized protein n=1 Tax=Oesophagostomum dentatum TaxID=61180 RepID=A0A0B1STJ1_OESDE|nr:hypothetical protein OESDEN_11939 [Oesophagostomum dentatum]
MQEIGSRSVYAAKSQLRTKRRRKRSYIQDYRLRKSVGGLRRDQRVETSGHQSRRVHLLMNLASVSYMATFTFYFPV